MSRARENRRKLKKKTGNKQAALKRSTSKRPKWILYAAIVAVIVVGIALTVFAVNNARISKIYQSDYKRAGARGNSWF